MVQKMYILNHTSGARYSGVPQNVFIVAASVIPSLQSPKSVIFMWPSLSNIRFSNCTLERTKQLILYYFLKEPYSISIKKLHKLYLQTNSMYCLCHCVCIAHLMECMGMSTLSLALLSTPPSSRGMQTVLALHVPNPEMRW